MLKKLLLSVSLASLSLTGVQAATSVSSKSSDLSSLLKVAKLKKTSVKKRKVYEVLGKVIENEKNLGIETLTIGELVLKTPELITSQPIEEVRSISLPEVQKEEMVRQVENTSVEKPEELSVSQSTEQVKTLDPRNDTLAMIEAKKTLKKTPIKERKIKEVLGKVVEKGEKPSIKTPKTSETVVQSSGESLSQIKKEEREVQKDLTLPQVESNVSEVVPVVPVLTESSQTVDQSSKESSGSRNDLLAQIRSGKELKKTKTKESTGEVGRVVEKRQESQVEAPKDKMPEPQLEETTTTGNVSEPTVVPPAPEFTDVPPPPEAPLHPKGLGINQGSSTTESTGLSLSEAILAKKLKKTPEAPKKEGDSRSNLMDQIRGFKGGKGLKKSEQSNVSVDENDPLIVFETSKKEGSDVMNVLFKRMQEQDGTSQTEEPKLQPRKLSQYKIEKVFEGMTFYFLTQDDVDQFEEKLKIAVAKAKKEKEEENDGWDDEVIDENTIRREQLGVFHNGLEQSKVREAVTQVALKKKTREEQELRLKEEQAKGVKKKSETSSDISETVKTPSKKAPPLPPRKKGTIDETREQSPRKLPPVPTGVKKQDKKSESMPLKPIKTQTIQVEGSSLLEQIQKAKLGQLKKGVVSKEENKENQVPSTPQTTGGKKSLFGEMKDLVKKGLNKVAGKKVETKAKKVEESNKSPEQALREALAKRRGAIHKQSEEDSDED
jgi:hypothetical protein